MLYADGVVVADHAQVGDHVLPICVVVAVADGAEYPRAVDLVRIGLSVEHAVDGGVIFVYFRVLGVEMEDSVAERSYAGDGIHALPNEVARIEVCAELGADGLAYFEHTLGVVDAEAGMKLEGYLVNAVLLGEGDGLCPIGNENLVPLPLEYLGEVIRPGADDPVGIFRIFRVAGAAGEGVYLMNAELFGEKNRVLYRPVEVGCYGLVRVDGVAVAAERAYFKAAVGDGGLKGAQSRGIGEQGVGVGVGVAGIAAAAYLDHLKTFGFEITECLFERKIA